MSNHWGVTTLDDLIRKIDKKTSSPNDDNSYLKKLNEFLKNIKNKYGNILTVAATFLLEDFNEKGEIRSGKNKEFAEYFENMERLRTQSKQYYLISIEYHNGYLIEYYYDKCDKKGCPILMVGEPDGLNFEDKMKKAKIYEIKSFNLSSFYTKSKSKEDESLIKKVLNRVRTVSTQLAIYQYLLLKTIELGLIENIEGIESHGSIILYSTDIEHLYNARRIIKQNFNRIISDSHKYDAYYLELKDEETIYMNGRNIYYFKIDFRTKYNPKTISTYLNNLYESLDSLKLNDNVIYKDFLYFE
ncbi:hypothetical protein Nps_02515 [Candidatus Nanopusillus acidilobi]|nr:hypothetical protein Nps_02515 [Candidatus Nanopusillus acidilobi]